MDQQRSSTRSEEEEDVGSHDTLDPDTSTEQDAEVVAVDSPAQPLPLSPAEDLKDGEHEEDGPEVIEPDDDESVDSMYATFCALRLQGLRKKEKEIIECANQFLSICPSEDWRWFVVQAFIAATPAENNQRKTISLSTRAIEMSSGKDWMPFFIRANARYVIDEYEESIEDYNVALELSRLYVILCNRGLCYTALKDYARAIADLDEAIQLEPETALAWAWRGRAFRGRKDYRSAVADFDRALSIESTSKVLVDRGITLTRTNDFDLAIQDFDEAIRVDPECTAAFNHRGRAFARLGDNDRSIADFTKAIQITPTDRRAYANRAWAFYRMGKVDEALSDIHTRIRLSPNSTWGLIFRGRLYCQLFEWNLALADYSEAYRIEPNEESESCKACVMWVMEGLLAPDVDFSQESLMKFVLDSEATKAGTPS